VPDLLAAANNRNYGAVWGSRLRIGQVLASRLDLHRGEGNRSSRTMLLTLLIDLLQTTVLHEQETMFFFSLFRSHFVTDLSVIAFEKFATSEKLQCFVCLMSSCKTNVIKQHHLM
jgi:hypothetical protein